MTALVHQTAIKMNGLGNEIVVMDLRGQTHQVSPAEARAIGKSQGLHYDQMMVLHDPRSEDSEALVLIYNIDGTEAGACGNGTRCVAWYLAEQNGRSHFKVETRAGVLDCERLGPWLFTVDMGEPALGWQDIPLRLATENTIHVALDTQNLQANLPSHFSAVNMGNPHAVFFVSDVEAHELARVGPLLETHPLFPQKANISLAAVTSASALTLKVWERGAGLTRACGSGACAAAVAAHRRGLTGRKVTISLPGGDLFIDWRDNNHVMMTGPVALEHQTTLDPVIFSAAS
jgi:diaminopimelate epimerase